MKNKYIIIYLVLFIVGLASCTDLTEEAYNGIPVDLYPENADQVAGISVASYDYLQQLADDGGGWMQAQEIS